MNDFPQKVKQKLNSIINEMSYKPWLFSNRPGHDFMRQFSGKLSFADTLRSIVIMGKGSLSDELVDFFDMDPDKIPSNSAFVQRRQQISLSAFQYLFSEFSSSFPEVTRKFKDHCILAVDGTHVVYSTNSDILEDYNKPRLIEHKGYNHMHLNGFVDVLSKVAIDAVIQPGQLPDEREALHTMLDHFLPEFPSQYIITADRGYESYDTIFHCLLRGVSFVFRMKSPSTCKCVLSSFASDLPDHLEEFDVSVRRFITDRKNKIIKEQKDVYVYMNPNKNVPHFYKLLQNQHIYVLTLRIVKVKTGSDTYEYLITNLPYETFCFNDIKDTYHYRWGCEVAFRYLKHATGMLHFHSKKPELLKQEIFARLTLYNAGIFIANAASDENRLKKRTLYNKYLYEIDYSAAIKLTRKYLLLDKKLDLIRLLMKYIHPVKEAFRHYKRPLRGISAIRFHYR